MKLKSLDAAPKEYFFRDYFRSLSGPLKKSLIRPQASLWIEFFLCLIFSYMITASIHLDDIGFPLYSIVGEIIIWLLFIAYCIVCLMFGRKTMISLHPDKYLWTVAFGLFNFVIELWFLAYSLTMTLVGAGGIGRVNPIRGAFISVWTLMVLAGGIVLFMRMFKRMRQRILEGHFREGGDGFFGNFKGKGKIPAISAVAFGIVMILVPISNILSNAGFGVAWNDDYWLYEIMLTTFFVDVFFFLFSYGFSVALIRIYYIKRFGVDTPHDSIALGGAPGGQETFYHDHSDNH